MPKAEILRPVEGLQITALDHLSIVPFHSTFLKIYFPKVINTFIFCGNHMIIHLTAVDPKHSTEKGEIMS